MFHGTMFSIKYNKPFCTIVTPYRENKFNPILKKLGLSNRIFSPNKSLKNIFKQKINYTHVNKILQREIGKSKNYLTNALK